MLYLSLNKSLRFHAESTCIMTPTQQTLLKQTATIHQTHLRSYNDCPFCQTEKRLGVTLPGDTYDSALLRKLKETK
jgi:hypothetical protein